MMPYLPKQISAALLAGLILCGSIRAETISFTLPGLGNFGPTNAPLARVDTLTVTLDPASGEIHGKPGETVGWGARISWSSNAGDSLKFTGTQLMQSIDGLSATGYQDLISSHPENSAGILETGTTLVSSFVGTTRGIGFVTIDPNAIPGTSYIGGLQLNFAVYDNTINPLRFLGNFSRVLDVSVIVDPVEPVEQTITFPPISAMSLAAASFTVSPTSTSALPVSLVSLNPQVCTVQGSTVTLLSAGPCTLLAVQKGNHAYNPAQPVARTFTVEKVSAAVTLVGSPDQIYDGTDKTLGSSTTPGSLPVRISYNGTTTRPRAPGLYLVQALIDDPVYTGSAEVMLTITDHTPAPVSQYASWLQTNFTPQEILDGTFTGPNAYLAGDGYSNLFKYAMGFDPWAPLSSTDREALLRMSGSGAPAVVFDIPAIAPADVTMTVQASSDLVSTNWQEIARRVGSGPWTGSSEVFAGTPNPEGTRQSILVTEPPTPIYNSRFYRLQILPNP